MLPYLLYGSAAGLMLVAAISDIRSLLIPNWIPLALISAWIVSAFLLPLQSDVIAGCMIVAFVALVAGFVFFAFGGIGGGDVKLFAASVLWIGPGHFSGFLVLLSVAIFALVFLWQTPFAAWQARLAGCSDSKGMPIGVAIAASAIPMTVWPLFA